MRLFRNLGWKMLTSLGKVQMTMLVAQMILGDLVVQIVRVVLEILAQVSLVASVVLVVVSRTIEDLFNLNKYKYKKMHHPYFLVA